jgi:glucose/arabinose dehydrogenase
VVDGKLPAVRLQPAFDGLRLERPVDAQQAPGDNRSWYLAEQRGRVVRVLPGVQGYVTTPFLDIVERTCRKGNEEGFLGFAFSPHFAEKGHAHEGVFYANYTVEPGLLSRLSRFRVKPGESACDESSEEILLEVKQPYRNHNGGALLFGPDGMLFWSLGDGGAANDPLGHGQRLDSLLGKILRLDVAPRTDGKPYGVPADNPFTGKDGARPEIWAYGLRNAWRIAFDRETGELWSSDVGQDRYEYVQLIRRGGNHGWNLVEGFHRFTLKPGDTVPADLVPPIWEYPHPAAATEADRKAGDTGLSITGGFVYRGQLLPELRGWYVCADYVTKHVWALRRGEPEADGRAVVERALLVEDAGIVSAFGQGHDGELLILDHIGSGPAVLRLMPAEHASK